jgi:acetolactate synthase-1/3 small subunit
LFKVKTTPASRSQILETVSLFRAKVVDVSQDSVTIEGTGNRDKLDALVKVLEPYGIKELVQSGMVAVGRGQKSLTDKAKHNS